MRLFYAITLSDAIKTALATTAQQLQTQLSSGRWTRRENYHLTLVFLGEMTPVQTTAAKAVLHSQLFTPFALSFTGLGRFRKGNRDIWWMGIEQSDDLLRLYHSLFTAVTQTGFKLEHRTYRPHLTLAREVATPTGFPFEPDTSNLHGLTMPVKTISLMESVRVDGCLVYREVDRQSASQY